MNNHYKKEINFKGGTVMKIKESLITRIDLEKLVDILKEGKEEFKEKEKKVEITFNGYDAEIVKSISYVVNDRFIDGNKEKLIKLGVLK